MRTLPILGLLFVLLAGPVHGQSFQADPAMKAARQQAADRPRKIIYNNDGNEPYSMEKFSVQAFLEQRTTRLVGTQVDSIFYCTGPGFGLFNHDTKAGQLFTTRDGRYGRSRVVEFVQSGSDPLKEIVRFGREHGIEVFWSMRMNDTHDGAMKEYGPVLFAANELKTKHPEWLLGSKEKPPFHGKWSGVNYEIPEIREKALRIVEDVCQRYDVDGIELDFFRHPTFFKYPAERQSVTDAQRQLMTDLMIRIRTVADEAGRQRGRPILIAMKVPDSVEYCRAVGLDLEKWLAEGLLDLLVTSSYFRLNPWDYSVDLGHRYGVKVYPSLDEPRIEDSAAQKLRMSAAAYRGRAAEVWSAGADGVYLYNFFKKDCPYEILRQIGDPKTIAPLKQIFFGSFLGKGSVAGGAFPHGEWQRIETLNPEAPRKIAPGQRASARLRVPAEAVSAPAQLGLRFQGGAAPAQLSVKLDGQELAAPRIDGEWWRFDLPPSTVQPGENSVEVTSRASTGSILWTDLMLAVDPPHPG